MIKKFYVLLLTILFCFVSAFPDNPIIQSLYTADPAPMVHNDTCYLYTTHDEDITVKNFYTMNDWQCYSSTDMVNWTYRGSPLSYKTFNWSKGDAWASQCIFRNDKFYMYVPVTQKNGGAAIGVAVATSPTGPFSDPLGQKLVAYGNGYDIDPTVFIDDDGQAFLYWGNGTLWYVKLNQDMISYSGDIVTTNPKPSNFQEGPWFYKRDSLYYMVYSTTPSPNEAIAYATSLSPTGPWISKGIIMAADNCYTNHAGIVDFKGKSFFFYHNCALPGGGSFKRSVCLEQFAYKSDGAIPAISPSTAGPDYVGNLNPYDTVQAETICLGSEVEAGECSEGGIMVNSIHAGDYIKVKGVDFGDGAKSFDARVASATEDGTIELHFDSLTGTLVGTCSVGSTGGMDSWETESCTVSGASGVHDLYLKFTGGGGQLFNFNWWKFTQTGTGIYGEKIPEQGKVFNMKVVSGNMTLLRLDFSQWVSQRDLSVDLIDLAGRRAATLFSGRTNSLLHRISLNNAGIRPGLYLVKVSLDGNVVCSEPVILQ